MLYSGLGKELGLEEEFAELEAIVLDNRLPIEVRQALTYSHMYLPDRLLVAKKLLSIRKARKLISLIFHISAYVWISALLFLFGGLLYPPLYQVSALLAVADFLIFAGCFDVSKRAQDFEDSYLKELRDGESTFFAFDICRDEVT